MSELIRRIDHVSIAVQDLAAAKAFFIDVLGGREVYAETLEEQGFRWTTIELGGSCLLELVDPVRAEGFLHKFLLQRGEGVHHVTVQVDDARRTLAELQAKGVETFGYSEAIPGWKEFFIHPRCAFGTLIQFAEFEPLDWVTPGYVPAPYLEFAGTAETAVQVAEVDDAGRPVVELADGSSTIRLAREELPALIRRLKQLLAAE